MKANEKSETIHNALFFDTETHQVQVQSNVIGHRLAFGFAAHCRRDDSGRWREPRWRRFETKGEFWSFLEECAREGTRLWCFCHNAAFDLPVLDAFNELPRRGWQAGLIVLESPPTILVMRKGNATVTFVDTLNIWRMPLAKVGEAVGLPKLTMPAEAAPRADWDTYARRDVEILVKAVQQWCAMLTRLDLGGFAPTLAGQAMRAFRHRFMTHPILIDNHTQALECARECYHGGRTEAWFIGARQGRFVLLDVNSMYPHVMNEHHYPTQLAGYRRNVSADQMRAMLRGFAVCARVRVRAAKPVYPVVWKGKLVFPVGEFDCALSTPELAYAIEHSELLGVYDAALYQRAPIFRKFVRTLYKLRQAAAARGDTVTAWQVKILMNSLYGKFGQRGRVFETVDGTFDYSPARWLEVEHGTGVARTMRRVLGAVQELREDSESSQSHPAIAAHVTAYARMLLWRLVERAGTRNVLYMDTDSLLVTQAGHKHLRPEIDATRLGALKLEARYSDIEIHGPKDYRFGEKSRIKGVKSSARWLGAHQVEQEQWSGLPGLIQSGRMSMPLTTTIRKTLVRRYDKGVVGADGRVRPFSLGPGGDPGFELTPD